MGISWNIHKAENLVSFSLFGQSSLLETVDALRDLAAAPDFSPGMRRLYVCDDDLTAVAADRFAITARVCDAIYARDGKGPMDRKVFEDIEGAVAWLNLPPGFRPS